MKGVKNLSAICPLFYKGKSTTLLYASPFFKAILEILWLEDIRKLPLPV